LKNLELAVAEQASKLQRLLALALNEAAADGEAMNALRAARKIVKELGGFDKCVKITEPAKQHAGQQNTYGNPFNSSGFGFWQGFDPGSDPFMNAFRKAQEERRKVRAEEMRREKEAQAARQREAAKAHKERMRRQAEETMNGQRTNIYDGMFTDEQKDAIRQMIIEMLGGKV
jgi:hypothetical protein